MMMMDSNTINVGGVSMEVVLQKSLVQNSEHLYQRIIGFFADISSYFLPASLKIGGCVFVLSLSLFSSVVGSMEEVSLATPSLFTLQLCTNGATRGRLSQLPPSLKRHKPTGVVKTQVTNATLLAVRAQCNGYRPRDHYPGLPFSEVVKLAPALRNTLKAAVFYAPPNFSRGSDRSAYLPEGAVFALPMIMDYDATWSKWTSSRRSSFIALHAVAIDLHLRGSQSHQQTVINHYIENMRLICGDMIEAAGRAVVNDFRLLLSVVAGRGRHIVSPAVGAGAFLRGVRDLRVRWRIVNRLARIVAKACAREARNYNNITFHLCLGRPTGQNDELTQNYRAFKAAFEGEAHSNFKFVIEVGVDSGALAQSLADQGHIVALIIAGNKNQLGNHWFDPNSADRAIEENVYRRSEDLAIKAFIFNGGKHSRPRQQLEQYSQPLGATRVPLRGSLR